MTKLEFTVKYGFYVSKWRHHYACITAFYGELGIIKGLQSLQRTASCQGQEEKHRLTHAWQNKLKSSQENTEKSIHHRFAIIKRKREDTFILISLRRLQSYQLPSCNDRHEISFYRSKWISINGYIEFCDELFQLTYSSFQLYGVQTNYIILTIWPNRIP